MGFYLGILISALLQYSVRSMSFELTRDIDCSSNVRSKDAEERLSAAPAQVGGDSMRNHHTYTHIILKGQGTSQVVISRGQT